MINILFLILCNLFVLICFGQVKNGEYKEYYENGRLRFVAFFKDGEGEGKEYYNNGNLKEISYYKDGERNGAYKRFYENGNLRKSGFYINDKLEGELKNYDENGHLFNIHVYKDGKQNGAYKEFYENGNLKESGFYKVDKQEMDGQSHENDQLDTTGVTLTPQKEGEWNSYFENGNLKEISFYKGDKLEGETKVFYENGQLQLIGYYKDDKREGEWKKNDENGRISFVSFYEDDQLSKIQYFGDGKIITANELINIWKMDLLEFETFAKSTGYKLVRNTQLNSDPHNNDDGVDIEIEIEYVKGVGIQEKTLSTGNNLAGDWLSYLTADKSEFLNIVSQFRSMGYQTVKSNSNDKWERFEKGNDECSLIISKTNPTKKKNWVIYEITFLNY